MEKDKQQKNGHVGNVRAGLSPLSAWRLTSSLERSTDGEEESAKGRETPRTNKEEIEPLRRYIVLRAGLMFWMCVCVCPERASATLNRGPGLRSKGVDRRQRVEVPKSLMNSFRRARASHPFYMLSHLSGPENLPYFTSFIVPTTLRLAGPTSATIQRKLPANKVLSNGKAKSMSHVI